MAKKNIKENPAGQMKETRCIYIAGQPVKNVVSGCDYKVVLGAVREVIFNFSLKSAKEITIEIEKNLSLRKDIQYVGVYDIQIKKLITEKFTVKSGVPYRVQVSRFFSATFVAKVNGKVIGRYMPRLLDPKNYGREAALWIEPMYIGFSEVDIKTPLAPVVQKHNAVSQKWLGTLPQFNNATTLKPPYSIQSVSNNLAGICKAPPEEHAVVFLYKPKQGERVSWRDVFENKEVTVAQMENQLNREDFLELVSVVAALGDPEGAALLGGVGFTKDNLHWKKALTRKIQVKWTKKGFLAIVFKGYKPPFNFSYAGLAHDKLKGMSGGMHIRAPKRVELQAGSQGVKNTALKAGQKVGQGVVNTAKQIKGLAAVGLVIDFFGDYKAVMLDEKGSREVGELLGRAGVSMFAAGAGVVLGSAALATTMATLAALGVTLSAGAVLVIGLVVVMAVGYGLSMASNYIKNQLWGT